MKAFALILVSVSAAAPAFATTVNPVPEPGTLSMVALGGAAGLFLLWRKRRGSK